jgi:uncharacterized protein (TIGR02266 family)
MAEDKNSRRYVRMPVSVEIRIQDADDPTTGEILFDAVDLSAGGAFVRSDYLLERDDQLLVSFALPGAKQPINVKGRVAWVTKSPKEKGDAGMAIEFVDLRAEDREAIAAYVRAHGLSQVSVSAQTP